MFKAIGKLFKLLFWILVILAGIVFFSDTQLPFSDKQTSSSSTEKISNNIDTSQLNSECKSGYYKNRSKTSCLKVPENATKYSGAEAWYCNTGYTKSGEGCIKKVNLDNNVKKLEETSNGVTISGSFVADNMKVPINATKSLLVEGVWNCNTGYIKSGVGCKKVKTDTEDKWWEKTDKYYICYGNITKAHKETGLHDRNRRLSVQIKEEICKIAATSTTGEGSAWLK